jgi:hypothetical protein
MSKQTMFINSRSVGFYFERYERTADLTKWEKVPELVNFGKLPPILKTTQPQNEYLKKNGAVAVLEGEGFHTGLRKTDYTNLFHGNVKESGGKKVKRSEVLVSLTNQRKTMYVAYFNFYEVNTYERTKLYEGFLQWFRNSVTA